MPDGKLNRRDKAPRNVRGVARQYRHFRRSFPGDVLFFHVGRFVEFYQPDDALVADRLGLSRMAGNRRGARFGFPAWNTGNCLGRVLRGGRSVVLIRGNGRPAAMERGACADLQMREPGGERGKMRAEGKEYIVKDGDVLNFLFNV